MLCVSSSFGARATAVPFTQPQRTRHTVWQVRQLEWTTLAERSWQRVFLLLASDGVWDLWEFDEVAAQLLPALKAQPVDVTTASEFCETTREKACAASRPYLTHLPCTAVSLPRVPTS